MTGSTDSGSRTRSSAERCAWGMRLRSPLTGSIGPEVRGFGTAPTGIGGASMIMGRWVGEGFDGADRGLCDHVGEVEAWWVDVPRPKSTTVTSGLVGAVSCPGR